MIRKFKAPTMKEAMKLAKDFFGDDAVVLSSRKVKAPGLVNTDDDELVEITVTADRALPQRKRLSQPKPFYSPADVKPRATPAAKVVTTPGEEDVAALVEKQEEVIAIVEKQQGKQEEIKKEIKSLSATLDDLREDIRRSNKTLLPDTRRFLEKEKGMESDLAEELIQNIFLKLEGTDIKDEPKIKQALKSEIIRHLHIADKLEVPVGKPKLISMVGPTGMGKTTTIIKLATHPEFYGRKRVGLITIDTYRVAAAAQLKTFAALAKIPLEIAYEPPDFTAALEKLQEVQVILIDTAGRSPLNEQHLQDLKDFFAIAVPDEVHLVLASSVRSDILMDAYENFSALPVNHLIISKIDETTRLGNIYNIGEKIKLPISFLTNGQKVPDDILLADKNEIARLIID